MDWIFNEIELTKEELDQMKNKALLEYSNYINNLGKKIIPELSDCIFNSEWNKYINDHKEELIKGNEDEIIDWICLGCEQFVNIIPNEEKEQITFLRLVKHEW